MKTELLVALIAGAVALASAGISMWNGWHSDANAKAIAALKIDFEKSEAVAKRQREISKFSEPLARSAYDLQSRFYNILKLDLIGAYLVNGNDREKAYVIDDLLPGSHTSAD
jgi:hypothetical protein